MDKSTTQAEDPQDLHEIPERDVEALDWRTLLARLDRLAARQTGARQTWLEVLLDELPEMAFVFTADTLVAANKRCMAALGYARDELPGIAALMPPPSNEELLLEIQRGIDEAGDATSVAPCEGLLRSRSGESVRCRFKIHAIPHLGAPAALVVAYRVGAGGACVKVADELTMREHEASAQPARYPAEISAAFERSQRLESLGLLAGPVAHDFNNLLVGIVGNANLASLTLPADAAAGPLLEGVQLAARQAAELTRQLLAYSGTGAILVEPVDASHVVSEMTKLLDMAVPKHATLQITTSQESLLLEADRGQLQQVVLNLVSNAAEALGEEASRIQLTVDRRRTETGTLQDAISGRPVPPGEYVCIEVVDNGCGMDAATLAQASDLFFTSKPTGRGLGLAAVGAILGRYNGSLVVESEPGRGTKMQVLLPSMQIGEPLKPPVVASDAAARPGDSVAQGTVLVVDDEPVVREVAKAALEWAGFSVVTAEDGPQAVAELRRQPQAVAAVLLDMTMPGIDGAETSRRIREETGSVPIILTSGYDAEDVMVGMENGSNVVLFLKKPFSAKELLKAVRSVLCQTTRPGEAP